MSTAGDALPPPIYLSAKITSSRFQNSHKNALFVILINSVLFSVLLFTSRECWPCIKKYSKPRFVILLFGLAYSMTGIIRKVIFLTLGCFIKEETL